jgi:hypothetical protein
MDAQELRSLQEAYMEVVENQQLDEGYKDLPKKKMVRKINNTATNASIARKDNLPKTVASVEKKYYEPIKKMRDVKDTHSSEKAQAKAAANKERGENKKRAFGNRLTRSDKQGIRDSYDYYDIILSHLLDEGYAETPEAAEAIMVNMSEEWRDSILG